MKILDEEHWAWMLYADEKQLYLSVLCGTVGLYEVNLRLTESEKTAYQRDGRAYLEQLARQVANDPHKAYQERHLATFNDLPGVKEATRQWREKKAGGHG